MSHFLAVRNASRNASLGRTIRLADSFWARCRGLIGRAPLVDGEGLCLVPCRAVHMAGMRQSLDVVFATADGRVVALYEHLAPGARTRWHRDAERAIELPAGTIRATGTQAGDHLSWELAA